MESSIIGKNKKVPINNPEVTKEHQQMKERSLKRNYKLVKGQLKNGILDESGYKAYEELMDSGEIS